MLTPETGKLREIVNKIVAANKQIAKLQREVEDLYAMLDEYDKPKHDVPSKVFPPGYRGDRGDI